MGFPQRLIDSIDTLNETIGQWTKWLALVMALVTVAVVFLRYAFGMGTIAAQESVIYMHSALFLLGAAFTVKADEHVRVDIFYHLLSERAKAWVNALGSVAFTLPVAALIGLSSIGGVEQSWAIKEVSPEPGGLPFVYLLRTLIPISAVLLALQAIAQIGKALTLLCREQEQN